MRRTCLPSTSFALSLLLLAGPTLAASAGADPDWNATTAEHLLNRAGFGATPEEVQQAVERGLDATVDSFFRSVSADAADSAPALRDGLSVPPVLVGEPELPEGPSSELTLRRGYYRGDGGAFQKLSAIRSFCDRWIGGMVRGEDPLRDRMTIFWHGHFVSSFEEVGKAEHLIGQLEFLRENALGDFDSLVRGIARDPAMLEYLNNDLNVKESPNENWARELMELFTLGVGNYTETDIKQAARAFSGWTSREGEFVFEYENHDYGPKTVLGVTGDLNGDDVIDIVLAQDACGTFMARKLLAYFEGTAPSDERVATYAQHLRDTGFELEAFLRRLFTDGEFYRDEILGNRVAAPVEYFVGSMRRLGLEPPADMLYVLASLNGQRLGAPPNVKGWEEGYSWMSTGGVMQRSNFLGILLGKYDDSFDPRAVMESMVESQGREFVGPYRDFLAMTAWLESERWKPDFDVPVDAEQDSAVVSRLLDRLLAVPVPAEVRAEVEGTLASLREEAGAEASLADPSSRAVLRELVHVVLSLPEAQLL